MYLSAQVKRDMECVQENAASPILLWLVTAGWVLGRTLAFPHPPVLQQKPQHPVL